MRMACGWRLFGNADILRRHRNGNFVRVAVIDEFLTTVCYRPNRSLTAGKLVFRERTAAERRLAVI